MPLRQNTNEECQPTAARRAFPCWDEPLLKATFSISLISRVDTVNLSNMSVMTEEILDPKGGSIDPWLSEKIASAGGKWKITRFEKTPPMSTYVVAYANGHFEYLESSYTSPLSGKQRPLRAYGQYIIRATAHQPPILKHALSYERPCGQAQVRIACKGTVSSLI